MLSKNSYTQNYLDECRKKVDIQLSTYKNMVTTAKSQNDANLNSDIESFETKFLQSHGFSFRSLFCS
jgi:hypothetical protein